MPAIVWHRYDLRLEENPALHAAVQTKKPIIPLYIFTPYQEKTLGSANQWWLFESIKSLQKDYEKKRGTLVFKQGEPLKVLKEIIQKIGVTKIYWNQRFDPEGVKEDKLIQKELTVSIEIFNGNHLVDPTKLKTQSGKPFVVYAPFWKALNKEYNDPIPLKSPQQIVCASVPSDKTILEEFPWHDKMKKLWEPGRQGALNSIKAFHPKKDSDYAHSRDYPFLEGTSRLSPHLHFGEISPREIWRLTHQHEAFIRQLGWREFATAFLYYFPNSTTKNWRAKFDRFPWKSHPSLLEKWQQGKTGYPIIDAAMRQLWKTGWMHNRLRMVVASFLVKDLFIHWKEGAAWFWDTLVDADLANNTLGWQWAAGSGPDAAPFFRIFNPILQGEKFDPKGEFIKKFVPELEKLSEKWIHKPWLAPESELKKGGIELGENYPQPIVNHSEARKAALEAYQSIK